MAKSSGDLIKCAMPKFMFQVSGEIQEIEPTDPFVVKPFRDQSVMIGNETLITDSLGEAMTDITTPQTFTAKLEGPFVNVNRQDRPDASITMTGKFPAIQVSILWDDSNSHPAERDAFYHTNLIHNFITTLDPNFTTINYEMPCAVNIDQNCNAFWDGTGINFFSAGGRLCPIPLKSPRLCIMNTGMALTIDSTRKMDRQQA